MREFTIINRSDGLMEVHAARCPQIKRRAGTSTWNVQGEDVDKAIAAELKAFHDQDQDFTLSDFVIVGCARKSS